MNKIDLSGRVAVVTGGASGLGRAAAQRLLQSGAHVALWDQDAETLQQAGSELGCATAQVEVTDADAVEHAEAEARRSFGRVDILINSAGIVGPIGPTTDYPLDGWRRVLEVNLTGAFILCRAFAPAMVAQGYGRILNVASMAGKEGNPGQPAYSAAKAGVMALTKVMGKELADKGVTVNAVAPAVFKTPLVERAAELNPATVQASVARIPLGRFGEPEEFAALAAWIVSDECSFTTGFTFDLSGGRSVY